jgi:hypothetical protein
MPMATCWISVSVTPTGRSTRKKAIEQATLGKRFKLNPVPPTARTILRTGFVMALAAQLLCQIGETIRDRRIEVLVQIDQIGDHHHHAMAMAQILDPSARADDVEDILGLFIKTVEEGLVNDGK